MFETRTESIKPEGVKVVVLFWYSKRLWIWIKRLSYELGTSTFIHTKIECVVMHLNEFDYEVKHW